MKKLLAFALSLSLILACMTGITLTASAATLDGEGTDASPFIIDSAEKFKAVFADGTTADLSKVYLLTGFDQTAMELSDYAAEDTTIFTGKLLGGNYADGVITPVKQKINLNITITSANKNGQYTGGIFHQVKNATISDLALYGSLTIPSINWNQYFGALTGNAFGTNATTYSKISRVDSFVDITATTNNYGYAGIAAKLSVYSVIEDCNNYGDFSIKGANNRGIYVGGIAGEAYSNTTITNCNNFGNIAGNVYVGGIAGYSSEASGGKSTISNCMNYGNISSTRTDSFATYAASITGLTHTNSDVTISNCYNLGTVSNAANLGLVVGHNKGAATITNFYDLVNPTIMSVAALNDKTVTVTNAYGYSETPSTTDNDVSKVSYEEIAGLTETFGSEWTKSGSYPYPMPVSNIVVFGTADIPSPIFSLADLKNVSNNPSSNYKLMNDIATVDEMLCVETPFSGVFDGNGKTITIDIDTTDIETYPKFVGLFKLATGTLKNVNIAGTLDAGYIDWQGGAGALVGKISTDTFLVENCANYATVNSTGHQTAGLVGRAENKGKITKCKNYGDVTATVKASGIVGLTVSSGGYLTDNANYGNITGGSYASGICSWTYTWNWMSNTFNVGTITALAEGGKACGLYGNMTGSQNVNKSFNAGALIGDITYGIGEINSSNTKNSAIKDCYNTVGADYPIANNHTTWSKLSKEYNYYLADESQADDGTDNTIVVNSKDDLKSISLTTSFGIVSGSPYVYPQVKVNPIDADYADIDFSLVTVTDNTDDNTTVSIWACDDAKFYAVDGSEVTVKAAVSDEDFYEAYVNGEKAVDGKATVTVNGDTAITLTTKEAEYVVPETLGNTMYAFNSDEKGAITLRGEEYTRYSLIFAKANKVTGLKRVEFGVYFGEDENISADNYKLKAVAESERISSEGAYGVLLYTEEGAGGFVNGRNYYVLPYSVYVDVDGTEYIVTGTTQTFSFNN